MANLNKNYTNPLDWIKKNVHIFIDECVSIKTQRRFKNFLLSKGYKKVTNVYDINYKGYIDAKILRYIIDNKIFLVTFDKKFNKTASKYNHHMSIVLKQQVGRISCKSLCNKVQNYLIHNFSEIRDYNVVNEKSP